MKLPNKKLLNEFRKFYEGTSKSEFLKYCAKHEITNQTAIVYLESIYGKAHVAEILKQ